MSDKRAYITVNEKQDHHNCEMTFSFYNDGVKNGFVVDKTQQYKIHTTLKEVEVLNEALKVYQEDGFKDAYLLFQAEIDGSQKYPEFAPRFKASQVLAKELNDLSNSDDSLVQLTEYCLETAPTYLDDFMINKQIESLRIDGETRDIEGYEDLKAFILQLKKQRPLLFK